MKRWGLACAAALAFGSAAQAAADFDQFVERLDQSGWRLVAVSQPLKQVLFIGPAQKSADGADLTQVRYEFMEKGFYRSLLASDAVNCQTGEVRRVRVVGYEGNNLKGDTVTATITGGPNVRPVADSFQAEEVKYACGGAKAVAIKAASGGPGDPDKMICHNEPVMGSLLTERVCRRQGDARERRNADRDQLERGQREIKFCSAKSGC